MEKFTPQVLAEWKPQPHPMSAHKALSAGERVQSLIQLAEATSRQFESVSDLDAGPPIQ